MNIHVVAGLHGDELLGLKVIAHLKALDKPHISTHIAHPEAIAKRTRYLDADLNRSFGSDATASREQAIAQQLLRALHASQPDLVLDFHTSRGTVGKVAITASDDPRVLTVAKQLGMEQVVVMPQHIAKQSLIGQLPTKALSLEFGRGLRSDKLARELAGHIANLHLAPLKHKQALPQYHVQRLIHNDEAVGEPLENYVFNKTLGGYPFMVGKNTYQQYRGFLAQKAG